MGRLGNRKGFSLVEMAIVLVIIGVIIGAIVKGQDLIVNARAKQVTSAVSSWRNLALAYLDRNGRLPGDFDKSGIVGDAAATEQVAGGTATDEIVNTMSNAPANPVTVGGMTFYVFFGNVPGDSGTKRNAIVLCKDAACAVAFTADELEIVKAVDTAEDGSADGGLGQFRAVTAAPTLVSVAAVNGRTSAVVTTAAAASVLATGTTVPWSTAQFAAVWTFDRVW
jgi:prepilin-type N-terminal cleavage/methylation domain-containing protein